MYVAVYSIGIASDYLCLIKSFLSFSLPKLFSLSLRDSGFQYQCSLPMLDCVFHFFEHLQSYTRTAVVLHMFIRALPLDNTRIYAGCCGDSRVSILGRSFDRERQSSSYLSEASLFGLCPNLCDHSL